jgi:hypothetical protein
MDDVDKGRAVEKEFILIIRRMAAPALLCARIASSGLG